MSLTRSRSGGSRRRFRLTKPTRKRRGKPSAPPLTRFSAWTRRDAPQKAEDGQYRGAVASVTSGKESISYAVNGNAATVYATAAANPAALTELLYGIAVKYLSNVPDANGVNLLYAGV